MKKTNYFLFMLIIFWSFPCFSLNRVPGINFQIDTQFFYGYYAGTRTLDGKPANIPSQTSSGAGNPQYLEGALDSASVLNIVSNARFIFLHSNQLFAGIVGSYQMNSISADTLVLQNQFYPSNIFLAGIALGVKFKYFHILIDLFPYANTTIQNYVITSNGFDDGARSSAYSVSYFGPAGFQANISYDLEFFENISLSLDVGYRVLHLQSNEVDLGVGANQVTLNSSTNWPTGGLSLSYTFDSFPCF